MKTHSIKPSDFTKKWVIVDAKDQTLGRLASQIAHVLRGKNKPTFVPHLDTGDNVIVINCAKVKLTGNKWADKFYHHHTGFMGGIKQTSAQDLLAKHPDRLLSIAVKGMLPKTKLGRQLLTNLRVYPDDQHGQEGQKPVAVGLDRSATVKT
ncbi:MAG: 50S ribosomal protein L13 [Proteobacteria bacterium]|nr:50S ribosomal protein L13 [Pseudomonadota bacterium]